MISRRNSLHLRQFNIVSGSKPIIVYFQLSWQRLLITFWNYRHRLGLTTALIHGNGQWIVRAISQSTSELAGVLACRHLRRLARNGLVVQNWHVQLRPVRIVISHLYRGLVPASAQDGLRVQAHFVRVNLGTCIVGGLPLRILRQSCVQMSWLLVLVDGHILLGAEGLDVLSLRSVLGQDVGLELVVELYLILLCDHVRAISLVDVLAFCLHHYLWPHLIQSGRSARRPTDGLALGIQCIQFSNALIAIFIWEIELHQFALLLAQASRNLKTIIVIVNHLL